MLVLATIPAVIVALLWEDQINAFFGGDYLGWGFIVTALALLATGLLSNRRRGRSLEEITPAQALTIGAAQAVAIMPGISRSGSTIAAGLGVGVERESATRFSFLMSIPAVLGSLVFQAKDILEIHNASVASAGMGWGSIALGVLAAMVTGYAALRWMLRLVKNGKLWLFGLYTGLLGILVLCDQFLWHLVF
jgi:undecaprenyl-diphosphatase